MSGPSKDELHLELHVTTRRPSKPNWTYRVKPDDGIREVSRSPTPEPIFLPDGQGGTIIDDCKSKPVRSLVRTRGLWHVLARNLGGPIVHDERGGANEPSSEAPPEGAPGARPDCSADRNCGDDIAQWIVAARSGSNEAFGQIFARCRGYLLTAARAEIDGELRKKTRPSSVVQQTMMTAQRCFDRFEGSSEHELLAWLRGILIHHLSDLSKFFHRDKRHVGRELSLERDLKAGDRGGLVTDEGMTPGRALMRDEEARLLVGAMARLPAEYREVIALRNWDCIAWEEVGQRMQRSAEAARKLWARAVDALRREMEQSDERPGEP